MSGTNNIPLRGLGPAAVGLGQQPGSSQSFTSDDPNPSGADGFDPATSDQSTEDDAEKHEKVRKAESERVIKEAQDRFKLCSDWESYSRRMFFEDLKFVEADSDNGFQWPNDVRSNRDVDQRPSLTINKTRQYCLQILNDQKQNKSAIKVSPVGGEATYESAQIIAGLMRHIEYRSNAETAYSNAANYQVKCGIGYWRVYTDYENDESFNQDIFIGIIKDPTTVFLDPDIQEVDGSDARYGFIFDDVPVDLFEKKYPQYKHLKHTTVLNEGLSTDWVAEKHVRIAEYWRVTEDTETLYSIVDAQSGKRTTVRSSKLDKELETLIRQDPQTKTREVITHSVEMFLIVGDTVISKKKWPGKYIPIVRVIGEEVVIDGQLDRKGHVRALKDPQRMYNYWTSSAVEHVALQGKQPYIAPATAIEGFETYWETANKENHAYLPYNAVGDDGGQIPMPQRQQPPQMAQAYIEGMQVANMEMMMVTGQYQANMGERGNEISAKAITERQRPGENATYHYIDNMSIAIRFTGRIIMDLIPKIYDAPRVQRILAEDGTDSSIQIDPSQAQALVVKQQAQGQAIQQSLNPAVGMYSVEVDVGPAYGTRRQEAFNALSQIIVGNQGLTAIIGDLMLKAADFPMADEASERLKRMVPPQALGTGPSQEIQQMQITIQNLQASLASAIQALANKDAETRNHQQGVEVDVYKAETDRLKALVKPAETTGPEAIRPILRQLLEEMGMTTMQPAKDEASRQLAPPPPPGGAPPPAGNAVPEAVRQGLNPSEATLATKEGGTAVMPDPQNPGQFAALTTG